MFPLIARVIPILIFFLVPHAVLADEKPSACAALVDSSPGKALSGELRGATELECLLERIGNQGLPDFNGPVAADFGKILAGKYTPELKLHAVQVIAGLLQKNQTSGAPELVSRFINEVIPSLGSCRRSFRSCDQITETLLAAAPLQPEQTLKAIQKELDLMRDWPPGLVQDALSMRLRAVQNYARFQQMVRLPLDGTYPSLVPALASAKRISRVEADLTRSSNDLYDLAGTFTDEGVVTLLPEYLRAVGYANEATHKALVAQVAKGFRQSLLSMNLLLSASRIYTERLRQRDPASWLKNELAHANSDLEARGMPFAFALTLFSDTELGLPSRHEWLSAIHDLQKLFSKQKMSIPFLEDAALYGDARVKIIDEHIRSALTQLKLTGLLEYEPELAARVPGFESAFSSVNELLSAYAKASQASATYQKAQSEENWTALNQRIKESDKLWFRYRCFVAGFEGITNQWYSSSLPLSRYSMFLKTCDVDPRSLPAVAESLFESEYARHKLDEARFKVAMRVLAIPSIFVCGELAEPLAAWAGERVAAALASRLAASFFNNLLITGASRLASSVVGAAVFTAATKYMMILQAPVWDKKRGLWENLGHPLLLGTAIFLCLPMTSYISESLAEWAMSPLAKGSLRFLLTEGVKVAGDTLTFIAADQVSERIDRAMGVRAGPPNQRGQSAMDSFSLSLAFRIAAHARAAGEYVFIQPALD